MVKNNKRSNKNKVLTKPYLLNKKKLIESKRNKFLFSFEIIVICFFSIIMLILLCNRTFFTTKYKSSKLNIDIPLMMFFKGDDGNILTLKTLSNAEYIKNFFNDNLSKLAKYNCNGYSFYYDDKYNTAIYSVKIKKDFLIKKVKIEYANGDLQCLCNANLVGKEAEKLCLKVR